MKNTHARMVEAAIKLFSNRGYDATTVGEIEAAAGLSPRSGGFYRHFKSKADVLGEIAEMHAAGRVKTAPNADALVGLSIERQLHEIGKARLESAQEFRPMRRIIRREAHRNRKIKTLMKQHNGADVYVPLLGWLETTPRGAGLSESRLKSLAVAVFGGLFFFQSSEDDDAVPFAMSRDAFLTEWAASWAAVLSNARA